MPVPSLALVRRLSLILVNEWSESPPTRVRRAGRAFAGEREVRMALSSNRESGAARMASILRHCKTE
jgi:hypothetical protein